MRDVIVIGAGGGGPVVAKELAARGLSVLLLEAGARHADPRGEWTHFENDANNPLTGFLRFGPADLPALLRRRSVGHPRVPVISTDDRVAQAVIARGL